MSLPTPRSNVCGTCGKCFKRLAALENHERLAHPKDEHIIKASCQERRVSTKKGASKKVNREIPKKTEILKVPEYVNKYSLPPRLGKDVQKIQEQVAKTSSFPRVEPESSRIKLLQNVSSNVSRLKDAVLEAFSKPGNQVHEAAPGIFTASQVHSPAPESGSCNNNVSPGNSKFSPPMTGSYDGKDTLVGASPEEGIQGHGAVKFEDPYDCKPASLSSTSSNKVGHKVNQAIHQARVPITGGHLSKKGVSEVARHAQNGKCLNITKNVSIDTYRCTDCKSPVDELDFLFSHDCSTQRKSKSKPTICRDCGYDVNSCSCTWRYFELAVREKAPSCSTCGRVFCHDLARKNHQCVDAEPDRSSMMIPREMAKQQHVSVDAKLSAEGSINNGYNNNDIPDTVMRNESDNHIGLKPKNDVRCPYCKKMFLNDLFLNNHMLTHNELQKFDCFYCRQLFPSGTALKEHLKKVHSQDPVEPLPDQEGGAIMTDSGIRWKCSLCPKVFSCKSNRRRHQMWHFGIRPHACELCGAAFRQRWQVLAHKKTKRCMENRLKSENLKVSGTSLLPSFQGGAIQQNGMSGEIEEGEIVEYSMTDSLSSTTKMTSSGHHQVSPTPASQASLPELAAIPTTSLSLSASQNLESTQCLDQNPAENLPTDTPLDLTRLGNSASEKNDARLFICQECGMCCKSNRNLMIHKRIHTGERPYSCSMCSLTFRQSHHRKAHMLSKHGVYRPVPKTPARKEIVVMTEEGVRYKCHYCTKVLASRSGRRKHERWHLGLRPHKCDHCGNTFKQLQHLKKHQMSSKCRGSPMKLIDPKGKKEDDEGGKPKNVPLTSWHMMQVLAENHRKEKALTSKDENEVASEEDTSPVTDVRSALGLISKEELKAKEEAKKLAEEARAKNQVNDENDNVIEPNGIRPSFEELGNNDVSIEAVAGVCTPDNVDNNNDVIDKEVFIKEEVVSDIEEGEIMNMDTSFSHPDGGDDELPQAIDYFGSETSGDYSPAPLNLTSGKGQDEGSEDIDKQLQCHICGQYYKTRQNLNIHMHIHTGERPHCCSICSKKFIQPHHLKAHLKIRHNTTMVNPSKPPRQEEVVMTVEGIRFKCQFCPKLLSSKNGRQKHERWHLGLRPHKCDVCGKAFKQSHHLKRHKMGSACIPFDQQVIKKEPEVISEVKQELEQRLLQASLEKQKQTLSPQSKLAQNPSDLVTNTPVPITTLAASIPLPSDLPFSKDMPMHLPVEIPLRESNSPEDLTVKPAPTDHLNTEMNHTTSSELPEGMSIADPQPEQLPSRTLDMSLPKDLTVTVASAKLPIENSPNSILTDNHTKTQIQPSQSSTLNVFPSKIFPLGETLSGQVISPGTANSSPPSKFTLLEVPAGRLPSPKAEHNSSLVKDLTCTEVLSELSSSDIEPSPFETPQGSLDQVSMPLSEVAEDLAPQDLSISSSKLLDLHCYE